MFNNIDINVVGVPQLILGDHAYPVLVDLIKLFTSFLDYRKEPFSYCLNKLGWQRGVAKVN